MDDDVWDDVNGRLALLADVKANWLVRVAEERSAIESAVAATNVRLKGHFVRIDVEDNPRMMNTWQRIVLTLVREADQYSFPLKMEILLQDDGRLYWARFQDPDRPSIQSFLTKNAPENWETFMIQWIWAVPRHQGV